ncbi:GNAT family N-acetyltransferase [Enterovibrio coralii]|uniref:N-acetyltransferase domain-containing protein n=1 Tax=Enterovibrio coralii TaxID=294935 RepID=A0A135I512_9GAMM|nr:N-acetyltransferase [Enterovibrio coralii]KXF80540.1 hypothetical protein ATN88_07590 [Enterovibrio coralii]
MLEFITARPEHYSQIVNLITSPEEAFLVDPKGRFPWDESRITQLSCERAELTVGVKGTEVVAFANIFNREGRVFIGNVVVSPFHRRQGVGRALLKHMLSQLSNKLQTNASISVFESNTPALRLYKQLGFEIYAKEIRSNHEGNDVLLMHMKHHNYEIPT